VGAAPNGKPNTAITWGKKLNAKGGKDGFHVDDKALVSSSTSNNLEFER
jgi:hypothetical protein